MFRSGDSEKGYRRREIKFPEKPNAWKESPRVISRSLSYVACTRQQQPRQLLQFRLYILLILANELHECQQAFR